MISVLESLAESPSTGKGDGCYLSSTGRSFGTCRLTVAADQMCVPITGQLADPRRDVGIGIRVLEARRSSETRGSRLRRAFTGTCVCGIRGAIGRRLLVPRLFRQNCLINLPPTKSNPGKHAFLLPDHSGNSGGSNYSAQFKQLSGNIYRKCDTGRPSLHRRRRGGAGGVLVCSTQYGRQMSNVQRRTSKVRGSRVQSSTFLATA